MPLLAYGVTIYNHPDISACCHIEDYHGQTFPGPRSGSSHGCECGFSTTNPRLCETVFRLALFAFRSRSMAHLVVRRCDDEPSNFPVAWRLQESSDQVQNQMLVSPRMFRLLCRPVRACILLKAPRSAFDEMFLQGYAVYACEVSVKCDLNADRDLLQQLFSRRESSAWASATGRVTSGQHPRKREQHIHRLNREVRRVDRGTPGS